METIANALLIEVYSSVDVFLLVFIRLLGFFIILPVFSGQNIPMPVKAAFPLSIAYIIVTAQTISISSYADTVPAYAVLMIKEFIVGFIIGFVVYLVFGALQFAGQLIDFQIGFSMVSVYDPVSQLQVPITGNLFNFIIIAFLVMTGGIHSIVRAMFFSYELIPLGSAFLIQNEDLLRYMMSLLLSYLIVGVQISLPIMGPILIVDVALGLLVKAVPQMNVFVVGMPLKLLIGLLILIAISPIYIQIYDILFEDAMKAMTNVIRGMQS